MKVCLIGENRGLWMDFADEGYRGDALDLVEAVKTLKTVDAMEWSCHWLGWEWPEKKQQKPQEKKAEANHDWNDPDWSILADRRGTLPEFPLDVFSKKITVLVRRTAQGAGVTTAHVGDFTIILLPSTRMKYTRSGSKKSPTSGW